MPQPGRVFGAATPSPTPSSTALGFESDMPSMISDGKRMRTIWRPEHGDGDSVQHVVERSKATIRGHPTWKILVDEISQPIIRGSRKEPPRYVYLDDQACFTIWKSRQYTNIELKTYWPFDFDHQGNIKTGRSNRGRPAWTHSDMLEIAKGKLRGNDKWYAFMGEPKTTEYQPRRLVNKTKMELQVEAEWAAQEKQHVGAVNSVEGTAATSSNDRCTTHVMAPGAKAVPKSHENVRSTPATARTARLERMCASRASPPKYGQTFRHAIPEQVSENGARSKPIPSCTFQDLSPDGPLHRARVSFSIECSQKNSLSNLSTLAPKYKSTAPFFVSNGSPSSSNSRDQKRAKLAESNISVPAASHLSSATSMTPKRKSTSPFLVSNSPPKTGPKPPGHKHVEQGERKNSMTAESLPVVGDASPSEEHATRGTPRCSPLLAELAEPPPDEENNSEEEFLAHVEQTLKRKREEAKEMSRVHGK